MVTPASLPRISGPIACLALLLSSLPVSAQEAKKPASTKVESEEATFIPVEYRPLTYQVFVGVRISGSAKVKFSGLGSMELRAKPGDTADLGTKAVRVYDNGYVGFDQSVDANGKPIPPVSAGTTNFWKYNSSNQFNNPIVPNATALAFQANSIESTGATATASSGSTASWDVEIARRLGGNKRISWGITFGAGLSSINAKTSGTIQANLRTITDTYTVDGTDPRLITVDPTNTDPATNKTYFATYTSPGPKQWAQSVDPTDQTKLAFNSDGTPTMIQINGTITYPPGLSGLIEWRDDSVRLSDLPFSRTTNVVPIDVTGFWQVKGAFITTRFGPYVDCKLGRYFALRASAGATFTVLGAQLRFRESYYHPVLATDMIMEADQSSSDSTVTGTLGYFVAGELEWFMTKRTGMFLGGIHESYARDLKIRLGSQTAEIAANAGTAFRAGFTTHF